MKFRVGSIIKSTMKLQLRWKRCNTITKYKIIFTLLAVSYGVYYIIPILWPPLTGGVSCPAKIMMYEKDQLDIVGNDKCEVINVALSCYGEDEVHQLIQSVTSMLRHTASVIKFYIVTDQQGFKVLSTLFNTWKLQHVAVELSVSTTAESAWLYYLTEPPSDVSRLLISPNHSVFHMDITDIWKLSHHNNVVQNVYTSSSDNVDIHQIKPKVFVVDLPVIRQLCDVSHPASKDLNTTVLLYLKEIICTKSSKSKYPDIKLFPIRVLREEESDTGFSNVSDDLLRKRIVEPNCRNLHSHPISKWDVLHSREDVCYKYRFEACLSRRVHLYFHTTAASMKPSHVDSDVTLVTQLQFNRLQGLYRLIHSWHGPMHVVLYLTDEEAQFFYNSIKMEETAPRMGPIYYHVVYKRERYNPINTLRNVGLNETTTEFVIVMDVDFVPSPHLYTNIINRLTHANTLNTAWLVPTFETNLKDYEVPALKKDFLVDLELQHVEPYHQNGLFKYKQGHKPHDYPQWLKASHPYKVEYSRGFEPYLIIRTSQSPLYPHILVERMQDKFAYTYEVFLKGITMMVLPDVYMVHLPHELSASHQWDKEPHFDRCLQYFYKNITSTLEMKYKVE